MKDAEHTLHDYVQIVLSKYFKQLDDELPANLYDMVITEVERALFRTCLEHTQGNQSKAAHVLGINRGTLRKKLKQYSLDEFIEK